MVKHPRNSASGVWANLLPNVLFLVTVLLCIRTTYYATGHFLDSDASSELVLAKHLSETGQILSKDWLYSTELRVLNAQLVYSPMFLLFSDWHLVRFFSALTLQAIYILSYSFMLHQAGFSKCDFYVSASLLLLPVSVAYGRIVLYHCHYITHIALSFFLVGLLLGFVRDTALPPAKSCIRLGLMMVFSFIGGLGGIRILMIIHAPMLLVILLICLAEDLHSSDDGKAAIFSRQNFLLLVIVGLALFAAFLGLKFNTGVFAKYYSFRSYDTTTLAIPDVSFLSKLLYGFLHQFGFREHIPMLSRSGILSLGSIPAAGFCLYLSFKNALSHRTGKDLKKAIVSLFFLCYWIVMTTCFLITYAPWGYYYPLYYVVCLPWVAPLLLSIPAHFPRTVHPFHFKRIFSWATVLILFANGFANTAFFNGAGMYYQRYEGLVFQEKDKAAQLTELVDYLVENGYDAGYGTYWEGNIMTELSDGKLPMTSVSFNTQGGNHARLSYYNWLTSRQQQTAAKEKPFLVLQAKDQSLFEASSQFRYCTRIYSDAFHCAYSIDNLEAFSDTLK